MSEKEDRKQVQSLINNFDSEDILSEKHVTKVGEKNKEDTVMVLEKEGSRQTQTLINRKRTTSESHKDESNSSDANEFPADEIPRKKRALSSGSNTLDDSIHMPDESGLTIKELLVRINKMKRNGLFAEYASIRMEPPAGNFCISKLKVNQAKNRYSDVPCFDHSRVILPCSSDDNSSDYINANFVDGYMHKNAFICTQGPLPKSCTDFWSMVWDNQSQVIVMTTRAVERSREKCCQYWPIEEQARSKYGEYVVYTSKIIKKKDYTETKLLLLNTSLDASRQITHLQFTSWPDYGVPPAAPFLEFLFRVRQVQETATKEMGSAWTGHPGGPPIIVHCSAGIGRTGTFVTVDISLRRLEDKGTVDIKETVRRIRSQRAFSIQVPEQYVFCHQAVIEHAQRQGQISKMELVSFDNDIGSE